MTLTTLLEKSSVDTKHSAVGHVLRIGCSVALVPRKAWNHQLQSFPLCELSLEEGSLSFRAGRY